MRPGRLALVAALVTVLVTSPLPASREQPTRAVLSTPGTAWAAEDDYWISEEIEMPVSMVALSWEGEAPEEVYARTKEASTWGPWVPIPIEDDHGPDPGTPEWERTKPATEAVWVGDKDGVQYRVLGGSPQLLRAVVIDTIDASRPGSFSFTDLFSAQPADGVPPQPTIRPRSQWDPSNSCQPRVPASYVQVTHGFVHHTTGTNDYTAAQVPGRILGICLFHLNTRGWDDIAYNFLIDKFGNIWEGRAGGISLGVQGAHTAGFSTYSTGIAFIGDHRATAPTAAARDALQRLLAWKFGVHNVSPTAVTTVVSKGSDKYQQGTAVALRSVSAHIDAQLTSCPGEACYALMGSFRSAVGGLWRQVPLSRYRSPLVGDFDGDGNAEAAIFRTATGNWLVTETNGTTKSWAAYGTKAGWGRQLVGDFNGDGRDDIANFHPSNGTWWVSRSTGSSFVTTKWADFSTASGWSRQIVGDFNGDGRDDIANFHPSNGTWWVSRSTGSSFVTTKWADFATASGWTSQIVGDFNGDGRDDIANFHPSNGTWWVSRSTGSSFVTTKWADFATASGWTSQIVGDFNGDGRDDIANFHPSNGTWWVSRSTGSGFSTSRWANFSTPNGWTIQLAGDFNGDGRDDIANRHVGNGTWWVSRSTGNGFATSLWGTAATFDHLSHVWTQDINNNGRTDIIAVDAYNGFLRRHTSTGSSFNVQTVVDTPWRTTLGASNNGDLRGSSGWVYFGQEFQWVRFTGLNQSSANAQVMATLPR